ncbi:hypothetical protein MMC15_007985 [Xylographa vitiligo]|nr:hypothetical protein [Xylographa vitiligo]
MPRLPSSLLRHAYHINPLLPLLLRPCRDLSSAQNELRWLREHVSTSPNAITPHASNPAPNLLHKLCLERARGKPLQYILGNQPFGNLDILCRPGVLIPRYLVVPLAPVNQQTLISHRPETESYTTLLAEALIRHTQAAPLQDLRILDLCNGTGCIALLLHALLAPHISNISIAGIDVSPVALKLAHKNLAWNTKHGYLLASAARQVRFAYGDVLTGTPPIEGEWDVLISNPPYISPSSFDTDTERSVRNYEPKLALVPPPPPGLRERLVSGEPDVAGDTFYRPLDKLARKGRAKIMVVEVAGTEQAMRTIRGIYEDGNGYWDGCEVWHDEWDGRRPDEGASCENVGVEGLEVRHLGAGHGRAVVCWRGPGREWLHGTRAVLA